MNLTRTVGLEEILWIIVALRGLWVVRYNRREAKLDLRAAKSIVAQFIGANGRRVKVAENTLFVETMLGVIDCIFVVIGLVALIRAPSPDSHPLSRWIVAFGLILCSEILTQISIKNKETHQITAKWGEEDQMKTLQDRLEGGEQDD